MEEDIKILEEFIEACRTQDPITVYFKEECKAIENLIARYKELEKHYQHEQEYINGEVFSAKQMYYIEDNYIDKSKVKEKIEEIKQLENVPKEIDFKAFYRVKDLRNIQIQVLKDLLED